MKQKIGRKLLGFLLALAMIVGFIPGMNLTVIAETEKSETIDNVGLNDENALKEKREFKDLVRFESYENLNSEITGDYDETHAVK